MFYDILPNKNFSINFKKELKNKNDNVIKKINEKTIKIELYGYLKEVEVEWLMWLAFFRIELPVGCRDKIYDFIFKPIKLNSHNLAEPVVPLIKEPIYIKEGFRLIARFPDYAISEKGEVYSLKSSKLLPPSKRNKDRYVYKSLFDRVRGKSISTTLHRLVGYSWLPDNNFLDKPIIDHLDNDKSNNDFTNLEWVSFKENNLRSSREILKNGFTTLVLDTHDGKQYIFDSVKLLSEFMNMSYINNLKEILGKNKQKLFKDRFIVKSLFNKDKWLSVDELRKNKKKPNQKLIAINIKTKKEIKDFMKEIVRITKVSETTIRRNLGRYEQFPKNNYVFKRLNCDREIKIVKKINERKPIKAIKIVNKNIKVFKSIKEASRLLKISEKTISSKVNTNKVFGGYIFQKM